MLVCESVFPTGFINPFSEQHKPLQTPTLLTVGNVCYNRIENISCPRFNVNNTRDAVCAWWKEELG